MVAIRTALMLLALSPFVTGPAVAEPSPNDDHSIWTFRVENDSVSTTRLGSDRYYTAGDEFSWTSGTNVAPEAALGLAQFLWGDGSVRIGLALSQQLYTPVDKTRKIPDPRDRPYAGYLSSTATLLHDTSSTRDILALSLGVIGPLALGEQAQNGVHRLIGDHLAQGWSYQLPNEPAAELFSQRTWRVPVGQIGGLETDLLPSLAAGVGTVRDYAQAALLVRVGHGLNTDFGVGRIRPGVSGGDAFADSSDVAWYIFAGADGQAVARDVFLDGNLFSRSAHVTRIPWIGELQAGFAVIWRGVRLSYVQTWQTEQFRHQAPGLFNFGSLALSMRF